jgi:hypothetical protein
LVSFFFFFFFSSHFNCKLGPSSVRYKGLVYRQNSSSSEVGKYRQRTSGKRAKHTSSSCFQFLMFFVILDPGSLPRSNGNFGVRYDARWASFPPVTGCHIRRNDCATSTCNERSTSVRATMKSSMQSAMIYFGAPPETGPPRRWLSAGLVKWGYHNGGIMQCRKGNEEM